MLKVTGVIYGVMYFPPFFPSLLTSPLLVLSMGASFSSTSSYLQYKNDFELVIRATKDLEHLLEVGFDAPSGKTVGLHDKITAVQASHGLSDDTVKKLRYVHEAWFRSTDY